MTDDKTVEENRDSGGTQDAKEYPSSKVVLPTMAAIWLAFFLVALVRIL